jgi:hypothetical protein
MLLRSRSAREPEGTQAICEDGGGLWCGVVVAAAVTLLLADAIGDAPVNVAGVGKASSHINIMPTGLL